MRKMNGASGSVRLRIRDNGRTGALRDAIVFELTDSTVCLIHESGTLDRVLAGPIEIMRSPGWMEAKVECADEAICGYINNVRVIEAAAPSRPSLADSATHRGWQRRHLGAHRQPRRSPHGPQYAPPTDGRHARDPQRAPPPLADGLRFPRQLSADPHAEDAVTRAAQGKAKNDEWPGTREEHFPQVPGHSSHEGERISLQEPP